MVDRRPGGRLRSNLPYLGIRSDVPSIVLSAPTEEAQQRESRARESPAFGVWCKCSTEGRNEVNGLSAKGPRVEGAVPLSQDSHLAIQGRRLARP